jgi:hypothetical protein
MLSSETKKIKPFIAFISKDKSLFKPIYWNYRLQYQQLKVNLKYSYYDKYDATFHYTNMYRAMRVIKKVSALLLLSAEGIR